MFDDQKVYLHCSSGFSRAPTLAIIHFCLSLKHSAWNKIDNVLTMIRRLCPGSHPNQKIAIRAISENQDVLIE